MIKKIEICVEDDKITTKDYPQEIHFYHIKDNKSEIKRKVQVKGLDIVGSRFYFNRELNSIILISVKQGLAVLSLEGKILFHDEELNLTAFCSSLNQLLKTDDKSVTIYEIKNKDTVNTI